MAQNLGSGIATMATLALAQAAIATLAVFHVLSRLTKIGQALTPAWPAQYKQLLCLRRAHSRLSAFATRAIRGPMDRFAMLVWQESTSPL